MAHPPGKAVPEGEGHVLEVHGGELGDVGEEHDVGIDEEHARDGVALHEQLHHEELHVPTCRVQGSLSQAHRSDCPTVQKQDTDGYSSINSFITENFTFHPAAFKGACHGTQGMETGHRWVALGMHVVRRRTL